MGGRFDVFVVFAEMRTGSNFLETNLNALAGVACHGEAFNPHFIGYPNRSELLGIARAERDDDPSRLLHAIREQPDALGGFRYFHDHDPRVLGPILEDPRCGKVVLTRNPAETYVSWKIAQATGQWKLTEVAARRTEKVVFDAEEFREHVETAQRFRRHLLRELQRSGQTAFHLDYEDLKDLQVINGLARFLDVPARLDAFDRTLKVQNPAPLREKVANFPDMEAALAGFDRFDLARTPDFEPRRAAAVPSYVAGTEVPLIFLPIHGGPVAEVTTWLAALDGVSPDLLLTGMTQKDLRRWKRTRPGHRSFSVLRHPVARAYRTFCDRIVATGPGSSRQIRQSLRTHHGVPLPDAAPEPDWDTARQREAFAGFLRFLKANLAGQTAIRVDAGWCSQSAALQGFADFVLPDFVLREDDLARDLPALAARVGVAQPAPFAPAPPSCPILLSDIYDAEIEALTRAAYQRDYMMFGFGNWADG